MNLLLVCSSVALRYPLTEPWGIKSSFIPYCICWFFFQPCGLLVYPFISHYITQKPCPHILEISASLLAEAAVGQQSSRLEKRVVGLNRRLETAGVSLGCLTHLLLLQRARGLPWARSEDSGRTFTVTPLIWSFPKAFSWVPSMVKKAYPDRHNSSRILRDLTVYHLAHVSVLTSHYKQKKPRLHLYSTRNILSFKFIMCIFCFTRDFRQPSC